MTIIFETDLNVYLLNKGCQYFIEHLSRIWSMKLNS